MEDTYRSQFRLPQDLYLKLKEAADSNRRSLNAELIARLEPTFPESLQPNAGEPLQQICESLANTKLADLMTPDEIQTIARRMLDAVQTKQG
jgi:hypothetical protein